MKRLNIDGYIIDEQEKWIYDFFEVPYLTLAKLRAFLNDAGKDEIELAINCYGGDVFTAESMYSELRDYKGKSTSKIIGISASASSFLMLGTDRVIASPMATVMMHNAQGGANGDYRVMEHRASVLKQIDEIIRNAYEIKTGKSREELAKYMDKETWLTAQDALNIGIIDEIDLKDGEKLSEIKQSAFISNKIAACLNPVKMQEMAAMLNKTSNEEIPPKEKPKEEPKSNENRDESQPVSDNQREQFNKLTIKIHDYKEEN